MSTVNPQDVFIIEQVAPSSANIRIPEEAIEEWTAADGGVFVRGCFTPPRAKCSTPNVQKTIHKARHVKRAKAPVEFYVNHCVNTACSFPYGHAGMCSHEIVIGKRGGRI
jgi:hypothetical protein